MTRKLAMEDLDTPDRIRVLRTIDQLRDLRVCEDISLPQANKFELLQIFPQILFAAFEIQSTMSSSNLLASMKALDLSPSQGDKDSKVIHVKNDKPIPKPRASSRFNAEGSSPKLSSTEQWDTSLPSAARNAESGALATSHRAPKSRRRQKPKARGLDKSWSMYPALHDSVSHLLEEDDLSFTFFAIDEDKGSIEEYDTNIMGRFKCLNGVCPKAGWASNIIAITIRMYSEQQYNARVYHQRCKGCGSLGQPFPDDSYAKRIAYRLKKWSGIEMDQPSYTVRESEGPHESALCEGCKHGHCKFSMVLE
ncbi:hypothetical protein VE04_09411 [Pseudogymnoascus sp. 24MN13]|nr:hypothetical protein VE04_09411 [Pseudogymnoascus sp. 24MN13]